MSGAEDSEGDGARENYRGKEHTTSFRSRAFRSLALSSPKHAPPAYLYTCIGLLPRYSSGRTAENILLFDADLLRLPYTQRV